MSIPLSAHLAAPEHTSHFPVHAQPEILVTVVLTTAHNVSNVLLDITSQQHNHVHHAQATVMHAQVLQIVQHAVRDITLLLMEHVYPTQLLKIRMLKFSLQDLLSLPSSSSSSSKGIIEY
jgi:hypothetical protein